MITYKTGDLFTDDAQCLVNAVNCVSVMGAGIAKEFKRRLPEYFDAYVRYCKEGYLSKAGDAEDAMNDYWPGFPNLRYIISAATKTHWRDKSTLGDIERVLKSIAECIDDKDMVSVAMPALGCGLGGLSWTDVQPLIEQELGSVDCDIRVYLPQ